VVIARVVEAQEQVIELVARDRMDEARKVMLDQAMPLQTEVHATFEAMRRQQAEKTEQAMKLASQAYAGTLWMLAIVGLAALAGSGAIALLAYRRTHRIALHDVLTGLLTRAGFHDAVENEIAQRRRDGGAFGLLYLDLDRFKPVNDNFGHAAGDAILKETAQRLRLCVRKGDLVSRLGGDEFAVVISDIRNRENCRVVARKIESAFGTPFDVLGRAHDVGASIGIALYPDDAGSADELIAAADRAMYAAKRERDLPAASGGQGPSSLKETS
jgi:diguanylate cyclase (GGDEF)-like protein